MNRREDRAPAGPPRDRSPAGGPEARFALRFPFVPARSGSLQLSPSRASMPMRAAAPLSHDEIARQRHQNQPQDPARPEAPGPTVEPDRDRGDDEQDDEADQDGAEGHRPGG